jgi:cell wall-associated NlpC family hydrolase
MRHVFLLTALFFLIGTYGQDTTHTVVTEEVDTLSVDKSARKEIKNICSALGIPNNPLATVDLLVHTLDWKGTPYCYGGKTKACTDCSGFTTTVYNAVYKKKLPRSSSDIHARSMPVAKYALYEGDLVFFATAGGSRVSHVGIYLWDGYFAHASTSKGVIISNLSEAYYKRTFVSGGAWID